MYGLNKNKNRNSKSRWNKNIRTDKNEERKKRVTLEVVDDDQN